MENDTVNPETASPNDAGPPPPRGHYPPPPPPRRRSPWFKVVLVLLVLSLIMNFTLLSNSASSLDNPNVTEKHHSLARFAANKIAIIKIEGTIMSGEGFVKDQLDRVEKDDKVKAVVLRINSPGGTIAGSHYIYHRLNKIRKEKNIPVVVSMGALCASGGYYAAMAVGDTPQSIYAEPTTWTGSIGVIIPHFNVAGLMERYEIEDDSVVSHPLKGMGSITREMTAEERAIFQSLVDGAFDKFKAVVRSGRPAFAADPAKLDPLATGQVFNFDQALAGGLVDREGYIEDAIDRALELAQISKDETQVVEYKPDYGLLGAFLQGSARMQAPSLSVDSLVDLTTPRGYYLCTFLPSALK